MTSGYRWVILALTVIGFMQTHVHRLGFAALIPTFVADVGLAYAAAGTVQAAYFWTYAIAQIPVGVAADRWGPRRVMVACMAILAVGSILFAASHTYLQSVGGRMLVGLGAAAVFVPAMRLISEWFAPAERGRATGIFTSGGGIGGTVGLLLMPWLAERWGWRVAYGVLAVPALVTLVLFALLLRRGDGAVSPPSARGGLRQVLASRALWPINVTMCLSFGGYFSFLTFLPAFLVNALGMTPSEAGFATSLVTAGTIVSWPLAGVLSDRLGRRRPIFLASQVASVLVCFVFAWAVPVLPPAVAMVAALATGLLSGGAILPFVMTAELFPRALAATAAGVANASCFVGAMVLPVILGRVVDLTGSFASAFLVAAGVQLAALVTAAFVVETGPGPRARRAHG